MIKTSVFLRISFAALVLMTGLCLNAAPARAQGCTMSDECLAALAQRESGGDYGITNQYNFLGKYQFGEAALIDAGYYNQDGTSSSCPASQGGCDWRGTWTGKDGIHSREQFLASPQAQENAIRAYQARTWGYIQNLGLDRYVGQTVGGIPITCDNLLTGYHLKGGGGLSTFLNSNGANDPADANGTRISSYLNLGANCQGMGTGVMSAANTQTSCDQTILATGQQLKEANMNIEKNIIDQMVAKPPSVMEASCFDQFGQMFKNEIGGIFSDINSTFQPLKNAFPGIFEDAQGSFLGEISGSLFGGRASNIGTAVADQVSQALNDILGSLGLGGGSSNVNYGCEVMNTLWNVLQCEDMLNFKIPSLRDLIGNMDFLNDIMPDSCAGKALFDGAVQAAGRSFTNYSGAAPQSVNPSAIDQLLRSF